MTRCVELLRFRCNHDASGPAVDAGGKHMRYSFKVVLVVEVEADNVDEAYNMADYHAGAMTEHEVEIYPTPLTPNEET